MTLAVAVTVTLGGGVVHLRPSLHCAMRLERREGSFAKLIQDLQEGSLTAIEFVLDDDYRHPARGFHILEAGLDKTGVQLIAHVMACAGIDPDAKPAVKNAPSVSFADHLANLYRIGTGWLGWSPEITLNSTPQEIIEAYKGRIEMLKAIFGGKDEPVQDDLTPKFQAFFGDMGTIKVKRKKKKATANA